jgi:hypothetical protein
VGEEKEARGGRSDEGEQVHWRVQSARRARSGMTWASWACHVLVDGELLFDWGQHRHDQQDVGYLFDKMRETREDREVGLAW